MARIINSNASTTMRNAVLSFLALTINIQRSTSFGTPRLLLAAKSRSSHPSVFQTTILTMSSDAKVCVPCSGLDDSALLPLNQVKSELESMPLWTLQEKEGIPCISRHYVAKSFQAALDSINAIGKIAEREGHHPDLHLYKYREVEVVLWTHKLGGLTKNDMELGKVLDSEVEIAYSPKWLKEHPEGKR